MRGRRGTAEGAAGRDAERQEAWRTRATPREKGYQMRMTANELLKLAAYALLALFGWMPICYLAALCLGWL